MATTIRPMTTKERLHELVDELSQAEADDALLMLSHAHKSGRGDDGARRPREIDEDIIDSYTRIQQEDLGASWAARQSIREESWSRDSLQ